MTGSHGLRRRTATRPLLLRRPRVDCQTGVQSSSEGNIQGRGESGLRRTTRSTRGGLHSRPRIQACAGRSHDAPDSMCVMRSVRTRLNAAASRRPRRAEHSSAVQRDLSVPLCLCGFWASLDSSPRVLRGLRGSTSPIELRGGFASPLNRPYPTRLCQRSAFGSASSEPVRGRGVPTCQGINAIRVVRSSPSPIR
jgi:hypothetical protein